MARPVSEYNRKRNFDITPEPPEEKLPRRKGSAAQALRFVIQKHDARNLHYDFRLELDGTLKSWAVPKGPSLDPSIKRMAIPTEDHPLGYAKFEGSIPHGQYGAGDVIVWDEGAWVPQGDAHAGLKSGKLKFTLIGEKLNGDWALIRTRGRGGEKEQWLLIKERDNLARLSDEYDILIDRPESVISGSLLPMDKSGAAKLKIPDTFSPELATLVSEPPAGDWLYEIKFDGYRMLARIKDGQVNLFTRNGKDWTNRLPHQKKALEALKLGDSWLDGEVVVLNDDGLPNFQALQNAFDLNNNQDIIFYLFDAPFLNGEDLRDQPVEERRTKLEEIVSGKENVLLRFSRAFNADHRSIIQSACAMSLEGVIGKRAGSAYVSRRSDDWIKLKCRLRQEFIIVGYTEPQGSRSGFGAILLGVHKTLGDSEIIYAGRVGTGFNSLRLAEMYKKMKVMERKTSPISTKLKGLQAKGVHWIQPNLICEVEFAEWTGEGALRQASFISLRTDKPVKNIIREQPKSADQVSQLMSANPQQKSGTTSKRLKKAKSGKPEVANVAISHPDRVIDTQTGGTKLDLAQFYDSVFKFILPHLHDRPVSILRAPDGIAGEQFFQKHAESRGIPHIVHLDPELDRDHDPLMAIDSVQGLVGCVQMNTIELHTWGSTVSNIEAPDRFVLDLDPDPALPWRSVVEAAKLTIAVLDELKLTAFLKTTGGKGMHIIVQSNFGIYGPTNSGTLCRQDGA
jgi:bifunctional non-homologous end joining protein LigD